MTRLHFPHGIFATGLLAASRKTQKRVNALKYNIIPRYQATVRHIRAALEEDERNTLFQIKVLRARRHA